MTGRNEEFDNGRSQGDFDEQFKKLAMGINADHRLQRHADSFERLKPIETSMSTECQNCNAEIEPNAVYSPKTNEMHYRCPECGGTADEQWFDYDKDGAMKNPWDGSRITVANIHDHLSDPDPKKPRQTYDEVMTDKWDDDHWSNKENND